MIDTKLVVDMNGVPLLVGQEVKVHQEEGKTLATVVEVFSDSPTMNHVGHWVDIQREDGIEGMMSYVLEVS